MAETAASTIEASDADEVVEVTDDALRAATPASPARRRAGRRPALAPGAATGRRKEAIARVRLVPGTGKWKINGRTLESYFPNKVHQQTVNEPFMVARARPARTTSSPASTAAASPARPARCASASPVR